jgi:hypothetical protein
MACDLTQHKLACLMGGNSDGSHLNASSSYHLSLILAVETKIWKSLIEKKNLLLYSLLAFIVRVKISNVETPDNKDESKVLVNLLSRWMTCSPVALQW